MLKDKKRISKFIGYNHNIKGSFGVKKAFKSIVKDVSKVIILF